MKRVSYYVEFSAYVAKERFSRARIVEHSPTRDEMSEIQSISMHLSAAKISGDCTMSPIPHIGVMFEAE